MNDSDFLSFFPEEDATAALNSEELALLFDGMENDNNGDRSNPNENESFDNLGEMLDSIEMLEEMLLEMDVAGETVIQEMTELEEETSVMFEGDDLEWEEWEHHQEKDLMPTPSLVPPFLQSYQTLQTQVANLSQRLAAAEQELTARQRRTSSAESLIEQQAIALTQTQEQLAHTVAELQVYQEACKHQQLQVETLTEHLAAREEQAQDGNLEEVHFAVRQGELQDQIALLTAENESLHSQVSQQAMEEARFEKHLEELRTRLQRQQRYALQYKSALEQCLAQPDFRPSSDISQVVARLTGQSPELKPWASVGDVLAAFPSNPSQPVDAPVADLTPGLVNFSSTSLPEPIDALAPETAKEKLVTEETENPPVVIDPEQEAITAMAVAQKSSLHRSAIDTLSFAVREQKPSRRNIELPRFLPRSTPAVQ